MIKESKKGEKGKKGKETQNVLKCPTTMNAKQNFNKQRVRREESM